MLREGAGGGEISSMISLPNGQNEGLPSGHLGPCEVIRTQKNDFDKNCVSQPLLADCSRFMSFPSELDAGIANQRLLAKPVRRIASREPAVQP